LPGNPVSALVCAILYLRPALAKMLGMNTSDLKHNLTARLTEPLAENDERQDYLRGALTNNSDGELLVTPFTRQDSSMLNMLAQADCLVVRPPKAPALAADERVPVIPIPGGLHGA
jgi:molybdopterin molybdotransferase